MTLAESLTAEHYDAFGCLNDGIVQVNGVVVYSGHPELVAGDVVEVIGVRPNWVVPEVPDVPPSEECE